MLFRFFSKNWGVKKGTTKCLLRKREEEISHTGVESAIILKNSLWEENFQRTLKLSSDHLSGYPQGTILKLLTLPAAFVQKMSLTSKITSEIITMVNQRTQQTQTNASPTKQKRITTGTSSQTTTNSVMVTLSILNVIMLLLAFLAVPAEAKYTLYQPKPGIHVEHIGTGKIRRGFFRIEVPYNYTKLTEASRSISNKVQQLDQLCKDIQHKIGEDSCSNLVLRLAKLEDHITHIKTDLDSYIGNEGRDGGGKLLTTSFNADNDAYLDISKLKTNHEELVDDSANILLSTVSLLEEEDMDINTLHENFQNALQSATDSLNFKPKTSVIIHKNLLRMHFLTSYQTASVYINEIINHYMKLSKILMQQGNLYDLLPLDRVNEIISSAMEKLPPNLSILPKTILDTNIRRDGDTTYIHGNFAVVDKNNFTLLEVIPVPLEIKDDSYLMFDIQSEIIAIDYKRQLYFYLSTEELPKSIRLPGDIYLCTPKVIKKMQDYPICVLDHIYERRKSKICETKRNDITSIIWKELYTKNAWMFITNKPTNVAILCDNNRENVPIDKSGILKIPQNCVIRNKRSALWSKIEDDVYAPSSYTNDDQLELNKPIPQIYNNPQDTIKEPVRNVFNILRNMRGEVKEFQRQPQNNDQNGNDQGILGHVITGLTVVSVMLAALVTYRTSGSFWKILLEYICVSQISSEPNETTRLLQNS